MGRTIAGIVRGAGVFRTCSAKALFRGLHVPDVPFQRLRGSTYMSAADNSSRWVFANSARLQSDRSSLPKRLARHPRHPGLRAGIHSRGLSSLTTVAMAKIERGETGGEWIPGQARDDEGEVAADRSILRNRLKSYPHPKTLTYNLLTAPPNGKDDRRDRSGVRAVSAVRGLFPEAFTLRTSRGSAGPSCTTARVRIGPLERLADKASVKRRQPPKIRASPRLPTPARAFEPGSSGGKERTAGPAERARQERSVKRCAINPARCAGGEPD